MRLLGTQLVLVTAWIVMASGMASAQTTDLQLLVVTVQEGPAKIWQEAGTEQSSIVQPDELDLGAKQVPVNGAIEVGPKASLSLIVPGSGVLVHLQSDSYLRLVELPAGPSGGLTALELVRGQAWFIQSTDEDTGLLLAAALDGDAGGYLVLQGTGTAVLTVEKTAPRVSLRHGQAVAFPGGMSVDKFLDEDGQLIGETVGVRVDSGQQFAFDQAQSEDVEESLAPAPEGMPRRVRGYARLAAANWLREAEQGEFTPVRQNQRREFGGRLADFSFRPEQRLVVPAVAVSFSVPLSRSGAVRAQADPLLGAQVGDLGPTSAVAARRFRDSRVVGSGSTGRITFNTFAESRFFLPGQRR